MKMHVAFGRCVIALSLLFVSSLQAQTVSPFQFMRLNYSARVAALGESTVATLDDASNVVINPATAAMAPADRLSATFVKQVADINSGMLCYVGALSGHAKWATQIEYQNYGTFVGTDKDGNLTGKTYPVSSVSVGGTYANQIDSNFYYGVGLNLIYSNFSNSSASAAAISAGLLYHIPNSRWNVGMSLVNLGTELSKVNGVTEPLPTDLRLGVNHRLRGLPLLVSFSFNHLADHNDAVFNNFRNFSIGGELYVGKIIELRLGYNNAVHSGASFPVNSQMAGVNFGVGLKLKVLTFDYALSSLISGVMEHRVSIQTSL